MQRKILFGALIVFGCFGTNLSAQTSFQETNLTTSLTTMFNSSSNADSWSFYLDEETSTYFIDFETINLNLSEIIVMDQTGDIVLRDDVSELPVNSIYEINCADFSKGEYQVELRSYTSTMTKSISVK